MNQLLKGFVLAGAVLGAVACGPAPTGGTEPQAPAEAPADGATVSAATVWCSYAGDAVCPTDGEYWEYDYGAGKCYYLQYHAFRDCNAYCPEPCVDRPVAQ